MLIHAFNWLDDLTHILSESNYTIYNSGLYCVEATDAVTIFSRDQLIEMDPRKNVMQLIVLSSAIGVMTCLCAGMALKIATQTRYYAIFQPKSEGMPPEYTQEPVQV